MATQPEIALSSRRERSCSGLGVMSGTHVEPTIQRAKSRRWQNGESLSDLSISQIRQANSPRRIDRIGCLGVFMYNQHIRDGCADRQGWIYVLSAGQKYD
jgi:hypothetical protein